MYNVNNNLQQDYTINSTVNITENDILLNLTANKFAVTNSHLALALTHVSIKTSEMFWYSEFEDLQYAYTKVFLYVAYEDLEFFEENLKDIEKAMNEIAPLIEGIEHPAISLALKIDPFQITSEWRAKMQEMLLRQGVNNQGNNCNNYAIHSYDGQKYRSKTEIKIAEELVKRGICFAPLPSLNQPNRSVHNEPDFIIFYKGKTGILEVNGEQHTGKATKDHAKFNDVKLQGVKVEFYEVSECFNKPSGVVENFLRLLEA